MFNIQFSMLNVQLRTFNVNYAERLRAQRRNKGQLAIGNRQLAIGNRQLAIGNSASYQEVKGGKESAG